MYLATVLDLKYINYLYYILLFSNILNIMLEKKLRVYTKVWKKISESKNIALVSHKNPDWDTLWSSTWLYEAIKSNFFFKKIDLICIDDISEKLLFIPNSNNFSKNFNYHKYDLIIFSDISNIWQTWFDKIYPSYLSDKRFNTINIDHHITNTIFARQNIVISWYASTTLIIYEMLKLLNVKINSKCATSLLTWILTDTWWFKHSNTDSLVFKYWSELLKLWWDLNLIINSFFKKNKLDVLRLWWKIIWKAFINENNILYTYINQSDLDSYDLNYDDLSWVIDYLNMIEWIKYSVTLTQKWEYIKWSLRTLRNDIDLSKLAWKYGWWWHKKASGFTKEWVIIEKKILKF